MSQTPEPAGLRLGRRPPRPEEQAPRLKLAPFLRALPAVPPVVDYLSKVTGWPMYANDQVGDCTVAAAGHMVQAWTRYGRGATVTVTEADVIRAYSAVTGYDPARPETDQGAVMQDVLGYWRRVGVGGHRIVAFAAVNPADLGEVRAALHLFGHVYVGANLPASALAQFEQGRSWSPVPGSPIAGGHAINVGYVSARSLRAVTWGRVQSMTTAWWRCYVEEAWVAISPEWLSTAGRTPTGLDLAGLGQAFTTLTGEPFAL
ncbi:hypothetical protein AB0395_41130 [Streptosporangium sp. NPDC051023]|uniref:hypothetical protein n=1 Tax=Streptosporangium sp. NPDC051023 TaxID=3155410 RepID=UPI00344BD526